jgi:hypothetical protein
MSPVGFEPTISAGERLQTDALDRAASGTGVGHINEVLYTEGVSGIERWGRFRDWRKMYNEELTIWTHHQLHDLLRSSVQGVWDGQEL